MMLSAPTVRIRKGERVHFNANPRVFATYLAKYIRNPSTIRARVMDDFGWSPSLEEIAALIPPKPPQIVDNDDGFDIEQIYWSPKAIPQEPVKPAAPVTEAGPLFGAELVAAIARDFKLTHADIVGGSRHRHIMLARRTVAYVMRRRGNSYPQIGRMLNQVDHSSALYAVRMFHLRATDQMQAVAAKYIPADAPAFMP